MMNTMMHNDEGNMINMITHDEWLHAYATMHDMHNDCMYDILCA